MKITKKDISWNYIGTITSLMVNILLLPVLLIFLDSEYLGLWYIFLSLGGIVNLFDFGFNPTFARNIAYSWSGADQLSKVGVDASNSNTPNIPLLKKVITTSKTMYIIISFIALCFLLSVGTIYIEYVSKNLDSHVYLTAWLIFSLAVFLNLLYGYYSSFLRGVGAIREINKATVISKSMQFFLSIVFLFLGFGIIGLAGAYLLFGLLFRLLSKKYFYEYDSIGDKIKNDNSIVHKNDVKSTFKLVWFNAWKDGLVSISTYMSNQASVLIISAFFSLSFTGIYSITIQVISSIVVISSSMYVSFQPFLQKNYVNRDYLKMKSVMSSVMIIYTMIFWIGIAGFILVGIPLFKFIQPNVTFDIKLLFVISIYLFLYNNHSLFASFMSNTNDLRYMKAFLLFSIISIIVSIFIVGVFRGSIYHLIYAQIFVQLLYNNWKWPRFVFKMLNSNFFDFYKCGIVNVTKYLKYNKK